MRTRWGPLLLLALLASGCFGDASEDPEDRGPDEGLEDGQRPDGAHPGSEPVEPAGGETGALGFGPAWVALDECPAVAGTLEGGGGTVSNCFEPTVAVDGAGRIAVTAVGGTVLAVGAPGAFEQRAAPPATGTLEGSGSADSTVQADREGRLVFSAFRSRGGVQAIQVAVSSDGAQTWDVNTLVGMAGSGTAAAGVDRQWVAAGDGGLMAATFSQVPTGLWASRSGDGGASFGPFARAAGVEQRGTIGLHGEPVFLGDDLLVPHFSCQGEAGQPEPLCNVDSGGQARNVLSVAVSRAGGAFSERDVVRDPPGTETGAYFPSMAATADGALVAVWAPVEGPLSYAVSLDAGLTWNSARLPAERSERTAAAPHVLAHPDGNLSVVWAEVQLDGRFAVLAAGFRLSGDALEPLGGPYEAVSGIAAGPKAGVPNTDLMRHAVAGPGRIVTVWSADASKVEGAFATLW